MCVLLVRDDGSGIFFCLAVLPSCYPSSAKRYEGFIGWLLYVGFCFEQFSC
jgi:hypothetical protein